MPSPKFKTSSVNEPPRLKILVSSAVYGYEDLLESIYGLLESYEYDVRMSHKGTLPVDPSVSAMTSCIHAVEQCDLFLGLILPRYGSGKEEPEELSITHRETLKAIELNKPRWFLVHEHVVVARQLLEPWRDEAQKPRFKLMKGIPFKPSAILSDLRVLELYEAAMRHDITDVKARTGNWVQPYGPEDDARLFATAQFRRHRELADKYLPKLRDSAAIPSRVKKGGNP